MNAFHQTILHSQLEPDNIAQNNQTSPPDAFFVLKMH